MQQTQRTHSISSPFYFLSTLSEQRTDTDQEDVADALSVAAARAGPSRGSSFLGSCPTTPSPVCSSLSCSSPPSFATPGQSCCEEESRKDAACARHIKNKMRGVSETGYNHDDDGRMALASVSEEQEEEKEYNQNHPVAIFSQFSGSEGGSGESSRYEDPDVINFVEERIASLVSQGRFDAMTRRNRLESKLTAQKEANTMKIMERLRKVEAAIEEQEMKKSSKAKSDMKMSELKLEKTRQRELNKMQRKIRRVQKEAQMKKAKEREATAERIAKVTKAFEEMAITRKLPWCFLCSKHK